VIEYERALCQRWRSQQVPITVAAGTADQPPHQVDTCRCWVCVMCRALESALVEIDRLTGAEGVGSGGVPLGG